MFKSGKHQITIESTFTLNNGAQYEIIYWFFRMIPVTISIKFKRSEAKRFVRLLRKLKGIK